MHSPSHVRRAFTLNELLVAIRRIFCVSCVIYLFIRNFM
jgi:hypothetical protein